MAVTKTFTVTGNHTITVATSANAVNFTSINDSAHHIYSWYDDDSGWTSTYFFSDDWNVLYFTAATGSYHQGDYEIMYDFVSNVKYSKVVAQYGNLTVELLFDRVENGRFIYGNTVINGTGDPYYRNLTVTCYL